MKKLLLLFLIPLALQAQDLQTGVTFTDGMTVHAADLNNAVNNATILSSFLSSKGSAAPLTTDKFLFLQNSSSSLKAVTLADLLTAGSVVNTTTTRSANTVFSGPASGAAAAPTFRTLKPADVSLGTVTIAASTIDWSLGQVFFKQLAANTSFTLTSGTSGEVITVAIKQAASGGPYTATFPGVIWKGGVAPTQTTTPSKTDIYTFILVTGVGICGSASQNY
jgi:hypothetical protein